MNANPVAQATPRSLRKAIVDHMHRRVFLSVTLAHAFVFWTLLFAALCSMVDHLFSDQNFALAVWLQRVADGLDWPLNGMDGTTDLGGRWGLVLLEANSLIWGAGAWLGVRIMRSWRARLRLAA